MRRWLLPATAAVLAAVALFALQLRGREALRAPHAAEAGRIGFAPAEETRPQALAMDSLPASLRGTEVDGELATDPRGHLIVSVQVRRFFDYFLSASGEESLEALRGRIVAAITQRLKSPASEEATQLLDRYLDYRQRAGQLEASDSDDLEARLGKLEALRRDVFGGEDAAALFGDEEEATQVALRRRRIADDPRLTPDEKQRALAEADQELPRAEREAQAQAVSALRLWQDEQDLRAAGASPAEIRALRESRFGPEAADRLEALDQERAAWDQRIERYRSGRSALDSDPSLTPAERTRAAQQLLDSSFSPNEQIRVRAILGAS